MDTIIRLPYTELCLVWCPLFRFPKIRRGRSSIGWERMHASAGRASMPHCSGRRARRIGGLIAAKLDVNRKTVRLWRERFMQDGLDGLWEIAPGRGRKATYDADRVKAVIDATLQSKPKGHTHWSCRLMAASQGVSKSTVSNLWKSHNIKPHRTKTFKLSRDPKFLEKLTDVIGLYLNPPDQAIVLCVDEKSQIQALQRTQPGLPLKKGR